MYEPILYHVFAVGVYACIFVICILALVYGLRARANVKKEKVTALPRGFSPLDVQRIFIGKTYPRKLTRALLVHWAQMGYIRITYVSANTVKVTCLRKPLTHSDKNAEFFDRGTYVRERDLFNELFKRQGFQTDVKLNRPLISRSEVKRINDRYAVREDEGVYSSKHYKLKVLTFILCIVPFFLCGIYLCATGAYQGIVFPFMMFMGLFVFRFMREIPFWFRLIWSSGWVVPAVALNIVTFNGIFDPWGLAYASTVILFVGSYGLIQFVDYREKNNLADYSDLVNYKRFLLFSNKDKLRDINYYDALPFLYAFKIKFLVKRKFNRGDMPEWFVNESGKRWNLL